MSDATMPAHLFAADGQLFDTRRPDWSHNAPRFNRSTER